MANRDYMEMGMLEVYTALTKEQLTDCYLSNSPLEISGWEEGDDIEDVGNIHFFLRNTGRVIGGGMIFGIEEYCLQFPDTKNEKLTKYLSSLNPQSVMWTDEAVSGSNKFISSFKPVINYLNGKSIDYCVIALDEEDHRFLVGQNINGKKIKNKKFKHSLSHLLG